MQTRDSNAAFLFALVDEARDPGAGRNLERGVQSKTGQPYSTPAFQTTAFIRELGRTGRCRHGLHIDSSCYFTITLSATATRGDDP